MSNHIDTKLYSDKYIRGWLSRNVKSIRYGKTDIILIGRGGTGKTSLRKFLKDTINYNNNDSYNSTTEPEFKKLKGLFPVRILDTPGQLWQKDLNEEFIFKEITANRRRIVINVCAYGYESFSYINYKDTKYYEEGMSKNDFLKKYIDNNLKEEEAYLRNILIRIYTKNTHVISFINKQDLWWQEKEDVKKHYENFFNNIFNHFRLKSQKIIYGSLDNISFYATDNTLLKESDIHSENDQIASLKSLIETIEQICVL